ncbi:tRNA guanosine(34) transglycosylase Tgt, partial [Candidatus Falkowbacteria bacterium]|nr:tRNA guanosine(34) transglycosylase Tgt [Candidatus Falkowbacteria bacterium]
VKTLSTKDIKELGAQIILSNTYHNLLRPGMGIMKKTGGLHNFMNWQGPILTDSGGFQVYSLSKIRKITDKGVIFQSHIDGQKYELTPKKVLQIQKTIGSDIAMVLDECVGYPATRREVEKAVERTTCWAGESKKAMKQCNNETMVFSINQGGIYKDLRLKSARELTSINFDGYAIGGLAVGEPWQKAIKVLDWVVPELPENKPRYLMGVGYPEQIIQAVKKGIDMFDCVIPTREGRHGKLFLWKKSHQNKSTKNYLPLTKARLAEGLPRRRENKRGGKEFYDTIQITNAKFTRNFSPINKNSKFPELREYSLAYLRHLFKTGEPLAHRLATLNNLEFYLTLMSKIRENINKGVL